MKMMTWFLLLLAVPGLGCNSDPTSPTLPAVHLEVMASGTWEGSFSMINDGGSEYVEVSGTGHDIVPVSDILDPRTSYCATLKLTSNGYLLFRLGLPKEANGLLREGEVYYTPWQGTQDHTPSTVCYCECKAHSTLFPTPTY